MGIEQVVGGIRWRMSAFIRDERDMIRLPDVEPRVVDGRITFPTGPSQYANRLSGRARGLEWLVGRSLPNGLSGWVSYSLSRTRYHDVTTGERFPGDFDAPHALNAYATWRWTDRMSVVTRFRAASNFPLVGYYRTARVPVGPSGETIPGYFLASDRNQARLPTYSRLDLRLNRTFTWSTRRLTLFAEVANVLDRTNLRATGGDINARTGRVTNLTESLFPLLPSAGFLLEF